MDEQIVKWAQTPEFWIAIFLIGVGLAAIKRRFF